jgi:ferredoxin
MVKISINQNDCLGCNFCEGCAPEIFEVDKRDFRCKIKKDGQPEALASLDLSPEQLEKVKKAVSNCPVLALKIEE